MQCYARIGSGHAFLLTVLHPKEAEELVSLLSDDPALKRRDKESGHDLPEERWEKDGSTSTSPGGGQWGSPSRGISRNSLPLSFGNHNACSCVRTANRFLKMKLVCQKGDQSETQGFLSIRFDVSHCFSGWTHLSATDSGKLQSWKGVYCLLTFITMFC